MQQKIRGSSDVTDTTNLSVQSRCLSLECDESHKYRDYRCGESLGFLCNKPGMNLCIL